MVNWLNKVIKAGERIRAAIRKRATKEELAKSDYVSCCKGLVSKEEVANNYHTCPYCSRHFKVTPTERFEYLFDSGVYETFNLVGARTEIPGCSLCMGNQARVEDNAAVFSTSTRNFDNRMGKGAQVYLGSAELAALCSVLGYIPSKKEYLKLMTEKINNQSDEIYTYLNFDQLTDYKKNKVIGINSV